MDTPIPAPVGEKRIHLVKFFVRKKIGPLEQIEYLECEFIGAKSDFDVFYRDKRRILSEKYDCVGLDSYCTKPLMLV